MWTIQDLKDKNLLLFECISGSKAYGLDLPTSDTDIKGVFILPQADFYGLDYVGQVNDANNDEVYYEIRRFVELLYKNNPNLLEMLATPADCVLYRHPLFARLQTNLFLSKWCKGSFAGYAMTQIRKARGLNKKIVNPMQKERKKVLDFCYVQYQQGAIALKKWLENKGYRQEDCGLVKIPHMKDVYGLYHDADGVLGYQGIMRPQTTDMIVMSSIPKDAKQQTVLYFNQDGYRKYCKDYKEYWSWVEKRNDARYATTIAHGKNYDSKNMMHTFRLLDMAIEILSEQKIIVRRPNRQELLAIRAGEFEYDELIQKAQAKIEQVEQLYLTTQLPEQPDKAKIEQVLQSIRADFYQ